MFIASAPDVYFDLARGHQNGLASFTQLHFIDMYFIITKINHFTL